MNLALSVTVARTFVFPSDAPGSGKSLCYSILPLVFDKLSPRTSPQQSIVVVISPLVSLMKDQVSALRAKGIKACYTGGGDTEKFIEEVHEGQYQVVFSSPENILANDTWREMLTNETYEENLVAFVIDEAHCVHNW